MAYNPRYSNGSLRRHQREYWRSLGLPCALCGHPIDYDLGMVTNLKTGRRTPHPMSFVIDEIRPVSRWAEFGYTSPEEAALDVDNQQPAHWICNARKGNRTEGGAWRKKRYEPVPQPKEW